MSPKQSREIATQEYFIPRVVPVDPQELRAEVQERSFGHSTANRHLGVAENPTVLAEVVDLHDVRRKSRAPIVAHAATKSLVRVAR